MADKIMVRFAMLTIWFGITSCQGQDYGESLYGFEGHASTSGVEGLACYTSYEDTWQTVYHEYEESVCESFTEKECQPFTRTSCSSVERRLCGVKNVTECGLDYTDQVDNYVESECKESCGKQCVYQWQTERDGSKMWVPNESTCAMKPQTKCQDVQKQKSWKKYTSIVKTKQEEKCELVPQIECQTIEDEVCFDKTRCDCKNVHKKVPIRVSTKVPKKICQKESHRTKARAFQSPMRKLSSCPIVSAKSPQECKGQQSTCWSPGVADLDCPKHTNNKTSKRISRIWSVLSMEKPSDYEWGYCCFDGCANTCLTTKARASQTSIPKKLGCPTVSAKSPQECKGHKSTCWSPGVADLDCPKHANNKTSKRISRIWSVLSMKRPSDYEWGYCCFNGCANTCLDSSSPVNYNSPSILSLKSADNYTNPCTTNPCGNGAMCIPQEGRPMCKCPEGMFPDPIPEVACSKTVNY